MKKKYIYIIFYITLMFAICFLYGCGSGASDSEKAGSSIPYTNLQNQIFYGTYELALEITPKVNQPSFAWQSTGLKYVVITIFKSKINIKDRQIANSQDAIWTWNTGMGKGREGNVSFLDGRDMSNGEILDKVTPLSPGIYYISAWGYYDDYTLSYSSREYKYEVGT